MEQRKAVDKAIASGGGNQLERIVTPATDRTPCMPCAGLPHDLSKGYQGASIPVLPSTVDVDVPQDMHCAPTATVSSKLTMPKQGVEIHPLNNEYAEEISK